MAGGDILEQAIHYRKAAEGSSGFKPWKIYFLAFV